MDPAIKARWMTALRSGHYPQGQGWLRKDGRYCCHGVLCDLFVLAEPATQWHDNDYGCSRIAHSNPLLPDTRWSYCLPPYSMYSWWAHIPEQGMQTLARMNDDGTSFDDIAAWIETHL